VLKAAIGILSTALVTVHVGIAQAFDPNTANPLGDGVVNKVNVDSSVGNVITNFEYEVDIREPIELSDGNVLLSGYMRENWEESGNSDCNFIKSKAILVKISPKGRLVTSFANGGIFTYERLDSDGFGQTVEDSAGNIYVIGQSTDYDLADTDLTNGCDIQSSNPFILKINANGTLNSSFGTSGSVISISGIDNLSAIALSGERLILSSMSNPQAILFALNRISGSVDNTFGVDGNGKVLFSGNNIRQINQILVRDKIYLFGDKAPTEGPTTECKGNLAALQWAINAVTLEGQSVNSFTNRPCGTSFSDGLKEGAYGRVFYKDGSIYVIDGILKTSTGPNLDRYDTKLLKIDAQGNIDAGYSKLLDSYLIAPPFSVTRTSYAVQSRTMDKDGRLLISYNYNSDPNAIIRLNEDGLPDPDFGYQGKIKLGGVANLLYLSNGILFAFVNYSSNPTSSLYAYNIETIRAKRQPDWSNYKRTDDGFSVEIGNYSSEFNYKISLAGSGELNLSGGKIYVSKTGTNGVYATISVETSRPGYRTDLSSFTGRSISWESLKINGEPNLKWDGAVLRCLSTNLLSRFDGREEVALAGPTEIYSTILDESNIEVARSQQGVLSVTLNRENMIDSKYYFCGTRASDGQLIGYTTSLESGIARLEKNKLNTELQEVRGKFAEDSRLAREESLRQTAQARVDWRESVEENVKTKDSKKSALTTRYKQGEIKSSQYFKELRALLFASQEVTRKLTEDYKNKRDMIPKNLSILLQSLEYQLKTSELDAIKKYWSDLSKIGIVVRKTN
jgi:hypothetical protein